MTPNANPDQEQTYDVSPTDRTRLRTALDTITGFLQFTGLDEEQAEVERLQAALNESSEDSPVTLREIDAARAVSALVAYRGMCLDDGDVAKAAEAEEAIRTFTQANETLAEVREDAQ